MKGLAHLNAPAPFSASLLVYMRSNLKEDISIWLFPIDV